MTGDKEETIIEKRDKKIRELEGIIEKQVEHIQTLSTQVK